MEKVLVTGATGFIGLHCIAQLLQQDYQVVGTVRSPRREPEVRQALSDAGVSAEHFSIVEADLTKDEGWDAAVAGCDYVLHVASPFIVGLPKHEDELIGPAVGGAERVLQAAIRAGVKKTVMTSSCAALDKTHDGKPVLPKKIGRTSITRKHRPITKVKHWPSGGPGRLPTARPVSRKWRWR